MSRGAVLLSGTTGFLGGELLVRWLERTNRNVVALVRAPNDAAAAARLDATLAALTPDAPAYRGRVEAVAADLTQPALGIATPREEAVAERVDTVVHCAASVNFEQSLPEARATNVEGTRRMLALAEHCARRGDGLRRYGQVSTAYVAGARRGVVSEDELDCERGFNNAYERSKAEAERLVRAAAAELPVQVYRPSIVVGDSGTGWTSAFNVLYAPLRAFAMGAFPVIPGRRAAPVDVVPVDYVADAVLALAEADGGVGETYHLVAGEGATTVGELIDLGHAELGGRPTRVVPPALWRLAAPLLRRRMPTRTRLVLERSSAYFPYFATRVRFDDRRARARLGPAGIRPPALPDYFARLIGFARSARWGRRPVPRAQTVQAL